MTMRTPDAVCLGHCGSLDWTVTRWGRVTHKHGCPRREDSFCQTHPEGCPSEPCQRCGGRNLVPWHAPSPLWNAVMRHEDGHDTFGIVCPQCFAELARERGIDPIWHLDAHGVDLPRVTPDGRFWDPAQCLWVDSPRVTR